MSKNELPLLPAVIRERIKEVADDLLDKVVDNDHWREQTCEVFDILAEDVEVPVEELPSGVSTVAIRKAAITFAIDVFLSGAEGILADDGDEHLEHIVRHDYPGDEN